MPSAIRGTSPPFCGTMRPSTNISTATASARVAISTTASAPACRSGSTCAAFRPSSRFPTCAFSTIFRSLRRSAGGSGWPTIGACCARVGRLVTVGAGARDEVIGVLGIAPERVEAVVELGAAMPRRPLLDGKLEYVRRKYGLPRRFVLAVGDAESRCNYKAVFDALLRADRPEGLVVCGRHTAAADRLLAYLRERHLAGRVDFIYEAGEDDRAALFRLACAFVCLHEAGAAPSVGPLVEAMRAGVPMLLNDIPALRDAAGDAAVYVSAADSGGRCEGARPAAGRRGVAPRYERTRPPSGRGLLRVCRRPPYGCHLRFAVTP